MDIWLIILSFFAIALMRVIQNVCSKRASNAVNSSERFFRYGGYYQLLAAAFALVTLSIVGFYGFDLPTVLCALVNAVCFALSLYVGLEAIKGCSLIVSTMFGLGGLIISCVVSYFWFGEDMSVFQLVGLAMFFVGAYLLTPSKKEEAKPITLKTYILLVAKMLIEGITMVVQKYFGRVVVDGNTAAFSFLSFAFNAAIMLVCLAVLCISKKRSQGLAETAVNENAALQAETAIASEAKTQQQTKNKPVFFGLPAVLLVCGALLALALFVINQLVTEMGKSVSAVVLFPISSAISILITTVVGWVVYKEKLTVRNFVGVLLGLLSIIVIGTLTPETVAMLFGA